MLNHTGSISKLSSTTGSCVTDLGWLADVGFTTVLLFQHKVPDHTAEPVCGPPLRDYCDALRQIQTSPKGKEIRTMAQCLQKIRRYQTVTCAHRSPGAPFSPSDPLRTTPRLSSRNCGRGTDKKEHKEIMPHSAFGSSPCIPAHHSCSNPGGFIGSSIALTNLGGYGN